MVHRVLHSILVGSGHTMGYFAEKLIQQNLEFPQGSVVMHHIMGTYTYRTTKDVHCCSYKQWRFLGIPNPMCGIKGKRQTADPTMGGTLNLK
eukprot:15352676-Ditylum_brightwellii.AAC.1